MRWTGWQTGGASGSTGGSPGGRAGSRVIEYIYIYKMVLDKKMAAFGNRTCEKTTILKWQLQKWPKAVKSQSCVTAKGALI